MTFGDAKKKAIAMFESPEFIESLRGEDPTMIKQLPLLKEINKHNFLTENSQAGRFSKGKSWKDGKLYEESEKAYITGFMLEKDAETFIKNMSIHTDKNVIFVPMCEDSINIPSKLDIPVTIVEKGGKIEVNTHMSSAIPKSLGESFKKQMGIDKSVNVVYLFCWDTKWNRLASGKDGLFTDVLKVLKTL
jgi:hypothetical protein